MSQVLWLTKQIDYESFKKVGAKLGEKAKPYFEASVFGSFPNDHLARIPAKAFHEFVSRSVEISVVQFELTELDSSATGMISEEAMKQLVQLSNNLRISVPT